MIYFQKMPSIFFCLFVFWNCATTQGERKEKGLLNWLPTSDQWYTAMINAATHPGTLVPLVGTAVIAAGDWDQDISDWAIKEKPIYGSQRVAENASDILVSSAHVGMILSSLAVPSGDDPWILTTSKRIFWEHAGVFVATSLTDPLKKITGRTRPNGGIGSFPSWHATRGTAYVGMGYRNVNAIDLNPAFRYTATVAFTTLAAGTAWARVEAGQHYPTDVLFGASLGNFIAILFHDAFLGYTEAGKVSLRTDLNKEILFIYEIRF
jgi:hypothetical protein